MIRLVSLRRNRVSLMIDRNRSAWRPAWSVLFLGILSISCFGQPPRPKPAEKAQHAASQNTNEVAYQRLDVGFNHPHCSRDKRYVVEDDNALQELIRECQMSGIKLPKIDFSKSTVIAIVVATDFCQKFKVKIIKDDEGKRYRHFVTAEGPMMCRGLGSAAIWVLIPKLPPGYEVIFEDLVVPEWKNENVRCVMTRLPAC